MNNIETNRQANLKNIKEEITTAAAVMERWPVLGKNDRELLEEAHATEKQVRIEVLRTPFGGFLVNVGIV